jgi:hypothetical protein
VFRRTPRGPVRTYVVARVKVWSLEITMNRLFATVGIALVLSTVVPVLTLGASSASAQEWRSRGEAASAADRDRDRGWRGQGNAGG